MKTVIKQLVKPVALTLASSLGPHTRRGPAPRLWLLMYHRVIPEYDERYCIEEPGMLVRPETLEMHIREVKKQFDLISLREWVTAHRNGQQLPDRACAITFDDGWGDNYEYAFPVLKAESAAATLFAVAEKIGTDFQFWPNIVAAILLNGSASKATMHPIFNAAFKRIKGRPSVDEVAEAIRRLKKFTDAEIYSALDEIEWRALCEEAMPPALMDWDQLQEMAASGLVEVGSHTCSHKRLTNALTLAELQYEIAESKNILEKKLQRTVDLFCFPNGDYNEAALSLVKKHYQASVTTQRGINNGEPLNLHELKRIGIHDEVTCSRVAFRARLSGWI